MDNMTDYQEWVRELEYHQGHMLELFALKEHLRGAGGAAEMLMQPYVKSRERILHQHFMNLSRKAKQMAENADRPDVLILLNTITRN